MLDFYSSKISKSRDITKLQPSFFLLLSLFLFLFQESLWEREVYRWLIFEVEETHEAVLHAIKVV